MARERSIATAILLAGDADLVEAVSQAQAHGVRVIVWGVQRPKSTMSPDLRREADRVRWFTAEHLAPFFTPAPIADSLPPLATRTGALTSEAPAPATATSMVTATSLLTLPPSRQLVDELPLYESIDVLTALEIGREFADEWIRTVDDDHITDVTEHEPRLPADADAQLIRFTMTRLAFPWATRLARESLTAIREGFWAGIAER